MRSRRNLPKSHVGSALHVMDADKQHAFKRLSIALLDTVRDYLDRQLPLRRIALVAAILNNCGIEVPDSERLFRRLLSEQKEDGGWVDCEDTAWALSYLSAQKDLEVNFEKGLSWLESEHSSKGWGFCARDNPCMPITAQIIFFLPDFPRITEAMRWLENQWHRDLYSPINLNYKAAWYLLSYNKLHHSIKLTQELFYGTIEYLVNEQRDNGSWGPWKSHPAPSEYFITGICMASLALSYRTVDDKKIKASLIKGIQWIMENQLEDGLFPTHYIEEGSAWVLFGMAKALPVIEEGSL